MGPRSRPTGKVKEVDLTQHLERSTKVSPLPSRVDNLIPTKIKISPHPRRFQRQKVSQCEGRVGATRSGVRFTIPMSLVVGLSRDRSLESYYRP